MEDAAAGGGTSLGGTSSAGGGAIFSVAPDRRTETGATTSAEPELPDDGSAEEDGDAGAGPRDATGSDRAYTFK